MRLLAAALLALAVAAPADAAGLADPPQKDAAMRLASSAESSSLDWRARYRYHDAAVVHGFDGLREGNRTLAPPLRWAVYGDEYELR